MQGGIKIVVRYILLLALLLCFGNILVREDALMEMGAPVIYYRSGSSLSSDDVKMIRADDADAQIHIPFTACGSLSSQSFVNPDLGKTLECSLLFISGDSTLLTQTLPGQLFEDDKMACLLSSQAAWELFGEPYVETGLVEYQEKAYTVRGVFNYDEPIVIVPAASLASQGGSAYSSADEEYDLGNDDPESEGTVFDRLIIKPAIGAKREEIVQIFENRNGGQESKTDCMTYRRLAQVFAAFIPMLILAVTMYRILRFLVSNRFKPFYALAGIAAFAGMGRIFFAITGIDLALPPDLIPSRWSDFAFWGNKLAALKTSITHILFMSKPEIELAFFEPLTGMAALTLLAAVLFCICMAAGKLQDRRRFFSELLISLGIALLAIFLMRNSLTDRGSIWKLVLLWPYYLAGKYLFVKIPE